MNKTEKTDIYVQIPADLVKAIHKFVAKAMPLKAKALAEDIEDKNFRPDVPVDTVPKGEGGIMNKSKEDKSLKLKRFMDKKKQKNKGKML